MKKTATYLYLLFISVILINTVACGDANLKTESMNTITDTPTIQLSVNKINSPANMPYLQSFVWARTGDTVLMIGGRTEGFHGLNSLDTVFKSSRANTSIWTINLSDFSWKELKLNINDPVLLPFSYSNMEFCQSGDTLYMLGGYGQTNPTDIQSNQTGQTMYAISVSKMINQVETQGSPKDAIIGLVSSPILQVAGGDLHYDSGWFYLIFWQNYSGVYTPGLTGAYTSAVRKFKFDGTQLTDTSSYHDVLLHRRDLNIVPVIQSGGAFLAALGGVFTAKDNGFQHPLLIKTGDKIAVTQDSLMQTTSQYACANASIYDPGSDTNITVLFGGIGQYQYIESTGKWEDGDNGAKLPFVKTITQMIFKNGAFQEHVQLPPDEPALPELMGANAVFFPDLSLIYKGETLDLSKIEGSGSRIGLIYGGISSPRPTSSSIYPSTLNKHIYEVILVKE